MILLPNIKQVPLPSKGNVMKQGLHKDKLNFGEVYETLDNSTWSEYLEIKNEEGAIIKAHHGKQVAVPKGQRLIFRSFAPYAKNPNQQLALFFWLERKITICLVVSDKLNWFSVEHIPWEMRQITPPKVETLA